MFGAKARIRSLEAQLRAERKARRTLVGDVTSLRHKLDLRDLDLARARKRLHSRR
jgi:hypothetical protein